MQNASFAQPLADSKETLSIESTKWKIAVPAQDELSGGHLQGIQLYNNSLFVSGSSSKYAYLGLFQKLGTDFRFIGIKKLAAAPFNHAGGFQIAENWLAVGIEDPVGKRQSMIQLIDISSFAKISSPPVYTLHRKGEFKRSTAGAVAILKREDHFLLAVGSWDCVTIDFYVSNGLDPYSDGFLFEPWSSWDSREAVRKDWTSKKMGSYQNLQLSEDSTGLYITGFGRVGNGVDQADVFKMNPAADPYTLMQKVASYSVQCSGDVTFRNGAGLATHDGRPSIIAVGHDLSPKMNVQVFPINSE
jgi:hypothetical protein